jgi:transporter family protein
MYPIDKLSVFLVVVFGVAFLAGRLSLSKWFDVAFIGTGAVLTADKG